MTTSETLQDELYRSQFDGETGDDPEYCEPCLVCASCDSKGVALAMYEQMKADAEISDLPY
jgi:hypothetical protein